MLDLRFGLQTKTWHVTAFANDALDRHYLNEAIPAVGFGGSFVSPGALRTYGIELGFNSDRRLFDRPDMNVKSSTNVRGHHRARLLRIARNERGDDFLVLRQAIPRNATDLIVMTT